MTDSSRDGDDALAEALARLVDAVVGHVAAVAASRGLAPTDVWAVGIVARAGVMAPGELGRALAISPSGTSGVIKRLVVAGLLCRDGGAGNQRDVRLSVAEGAADDLPLAPGSQMSAACKRLVLSADERDALVKVVLCLLELVEGDTETMRVKVEKARAPEPAPAPPRWA